MFTIRGEIDRKVYSIKYLDGKLSGDELAVSRALAESNRDHGIVGLGPDALIGDYLSQEIPAHELISNFVFDTITAEENDWEKIPDDAIF